MPTRSHRRSRDAPPGLRTRPAPLGGLPDPPSQADAKRPTPNPIEHAERAYAGTGPRPHLMTMNCFDNSHDHRGRECPTSTPPTNSPAQVRRAGLARRLTSVTNPLKAFQIHQAGLIPRAYVQTHAVLPCRGQRKKPRVQGANSGGPARPGWLGAHAATDLPRQLQRVGFTAVSE